MTTPRRLHRWLVLGLVLLLIFLLIFSPVLPALSGLLATYLVPLKQTAAMWINEQNSPNKSVKTKGHLG